MSWGKWSIEHAEGTYFITVDKPFWHQYRSWLFFLNIYADFLLVILSDL